MNKEIETDKWRMFIKTPLENGLDESFVNLIFRLKNNPSGKPINQENLDELEKDLKDLGKWTKFKELRRDLEK